MRFEELCALRMQYGEGTWLAPYGENEYAGFGTGKGDVEGPRIRGTMHWANHPRRREDLVWCPDLNGTIATADGAKILVSIKGYSIIEKTPTVNRAIVAAVWFQTDDARYRWLNYYLGIAEGEIDETTEEWWIRISAVRNDGAKAQTKIEAAKWPRGRSPELLDDQVFHGRAPPRRPTR